MGQQAVEIHSLNADLMSGSLRVHNIYIYISVIPRYIAIATSVSE